MQAEKPPEFLRLAEKPPGMFFAASRRQKIQLEHAQSCQYKGAG